MAWIKGKDKKPNVGDLVALEGVAEMSKELEKRARAWLKKNPGFK